MVVWYDLGSWPMTLTFKAMEFLKEEDICLHFFPCKNSAPCCDPPYPWDHDLNKIWINTTWVYFHTFHQVSEENYKEFSFYSEVSNSTCIMTHPTPRFHNLNNLNIQYRQRGSCIGPRYRHGTFIIPTIHHRVFCTFWGKTKLS